MARDMQIKLPRLTETTVIFVRMMPGWNERRSAMPGIRWKTMNKYLWLRYSLRNWLTENAPSLALLRERLNLALRVMPEMEARGFVPPLHSWFKRSMIRRSSQAIGSRVLIETGTYLGDTPWAFRDDFLEIHSIEVQPELAELARRRFRRFPHIHIVEGDSAERLKEVVDHLRAPTLFWLDGHYSGGFTGRGRVDCPIWDELQVIFDRIKVPFGLMIDDARCFGSEPGYPSLDEVCTYLSGRRDDYELSVENDVIFFLPRRAVI
jgi:hypothetical protein